jgi:ferrochelatase
LVVLSSPFDAVLVVAFGGPQGPGDVRPFLANVLRGRRVPQARIEEVAAHYERFGGRSPLTELTRQQAVALADRLRERGPGLPVFVGMRNWHPYLIETLEEMASQGIRRAIGLLMAAQRSYSGCLQYKENVADARVELRSRGHADIEVVYAGDWHADQGFIGANAAHVREALDRLPPDRRARARLVFTAHSIPEDMAHAYPYERQIRESAALVAAQVGAQDWAVAYQSRSGRPGDPWLEPDICDYLRAERAKGLDAVVVCPIGFVCDHLEVLYDLDVQAAAVAREVGIAMTRAGTACTHPLFIDGLAEAVRGTWVRFASGRPLPLVAAGGPRHGRPTLP